jgi:hypothetical protein
MHMRAIEAMPTAVLFKLPLNVHSAMPREGFGKRWQLEMASDHRVIAGLSSTSAKVSLTNARREDSPCPKLRIATNVGADAKFDSAAGQEILDKTAGDTGAHANNATAIAVVDESANGQLHGKNSQSMVIPDHSELFKGQFVASKPKRDTKTSPIDRPACAVSQDQLSPAVSVAAPCGAPQCAGSGRRANSGGDRLPGENLTPVTVSIAARADGTAAAAESGKSAKPQSALKIAAVAASEKESPQSVHPPPEHHMKHPGEASNIMPAPAEANISGKTETESSSVIFHTIQSATQIVALPTAIPNHPSPPPMRVIAQMDLANLVDAADIKSPQILASGPAQLDVGVFDGTHGWLRIRAELDAAGAVNASLTASESVHAALRAALPELANYLGSETIRVNTIALHRFPESPHFTPAAQIRDSGSVHGYRNHGEQNPDTQKRYSGSMGQTQDCAAGTANPGTNSDQSSQSGRGDSSRRVLSAKSKPLSLFGFVGRTSGSWLNVCA